MLMPSIFGENLFDEMMRFPSERDFFQRNSFPEMRKDLMKTDIREVNGNYELDIDLPGFKKEDMKLQLKDGNLTIQASRTDNKDEKDDKGRYIRRERYTGHCSRSFYIGKSIRQEDVHAKYEDGILKLTFPKEETKKEIEDKKYIAIEG
ncbi:MAG: Hsp20/alpha crystallin family protein [Eubacteriales bacterium]|nr:Hsp20/alpha crystallin family protein [Eubacteriales bacterium]